MERFEYGHTVLGKVNKIFVQLNNSKVIIKMFE